MTLLTSALWRIAAVLACIVAAGVLVRQVTRDDVVIMPFDLAKSLEDAGVTPRMVTQWFADEMVAVGGSARSRILAQTPVTFERLPQDFTIASTRISVRSLVENLRYYMGYWVIASGELDDLGGKVRLTIRVSGKGYAQRTRDIVSGDRATALKDVIADGAVATVERISPFLGAAYHYTRGARFDRETERDIFEALETGNREELAPAFALAYSNDGLVAEREGRTHVALERYRRVVQLDPGLAIARAYFGTALCATASAEPLHTRRCEEGLLHLRSAVRLDPHDPLIVVALAETLLRAGHVDEARNALTTASMAFPRNPQVLIELGRLHQSTAESLLFMDKRLETDDYTAIDAALDEAEHAYTRRAALMSQHIEESELDLGNVAYDSGLAWLARSR